MVKGTFNINCAPHSTSKRMFLPSLQRQQWPSVSRGAGGSEKIPLIRPGLLRTPHSVFNLVFIFEIAFEENGGGREEVQKKELEF